MCNNNNYGTAPIYGSRNSFNAVAGNAGFRKRQSYINFDPAGGSVGVYSDFITAATCDQIYKSHIIQKVDTVAGGAQGVYQVAVSATIYLKHLHDFWAKLPMIKSAYFTIGLQLNNTAFTMNKSAAADAGQLLTLVRVNSSTGGVNPLLVASMSGGCGGGAFNRVGLADTNITCSIAVGSKVLEPTQMNIGTTSGAIGNSITLNVPAYVLHPRFHDAFTAIGVRAVPYTDFYQMTVASQGAGSNVNAILTNGVAGLRRITIFPTASPQAVNTFLYDGCQTYHSPFDTALTSGNSGCPFAHIGQFQVQVSGSNAMGQMERYGYEQWVQEMSGSGTGYGLMAGVSSGLLSQHQWEMAPVYTVDISRMAAAERSVPRSVQLQGVNLSTCDIDYLCFLEFDQIGLKLDLRTGERV